jgi:hypothetical protein
MVWVGLDGVDGAGKSTLAKAVRDELASQLGRVELIHKGPPECDVLEEYATDVEGREDENLVFDRWHLGELVYPSLYRNQGPYGALGLAGFRWVEKFLQARGTVIYVCDLPYDVVSERLKTRGEDYLQANHVAGVIERFRKVRDMSVIAAPKFDMAETLDDVPELARNVVSDAVENAEQHASLRAFPSYVGGVRPSVLLVGEKRGGQPPFESGACFMPLRNKSGQYFWNYLPEDLWRGCGVANAKEDHIGALWLVLGRPPIVALGREASRTLDGIALLHAAVPHPQAVKRFANRRGAEYGRLIAEVAGTHEKEFSWLSS